MLLEILLQWFCVSRRLHLKYGSPLQGGGLTGRFGFVAMFSVDMDDTPELPARSGRLFRSKRALALESVEAQPAPKARRGAARESDAGTRKPATEGRKRRPAAAQRAEVSFPSATRILAILRSETVLPPRPVVRRHPHELLVGSACSGLCTELFSLEELRRRAQPVFYCEHDEGLLKLSREMHQHELEFKDVFDPSFGAAPYVDLLFAGFPCQGFSSMGSRTGTSHASGLCVVPILQYIHNRRPRAFCLENVKALTTEHRDFFGKLLEVLAAMCAGAGEPLQRRCRSL